MITGFSPQGTFFQTLTSPANTTKRHASVPPKLKALQAFTISKIDETEADYG